MSVLTVNAIPTNSSIVLISSGAEQTGNTIAVEPGSTVAVRVYCDGYITQSDSVVVNENMVKEYVLQPETYTVTLDVYPQDATASTTVNGIEETGKVRQAKFGELLSFNVEKQGYKARQGSFVVSKSMTKKIILVANRKEIDPFDDTIKEHRNISKLYPEQFTNKKLLNSYVKSVVDPFFEKPDEKEIEGYIGKRNNTTNKADQYIEERTVERQNNQLVPVGVTSSELGNEVLTFKNFVAQLKECGIPTDNENKYLKGKQWAWCPLINVDMFVNYSLYHWLGYDEEKLPLLKLKKETNAIQDIIGKEHYTYIGDVETYLGHEQISTAEMSLEFSDGLRIMFMNDGNPEYNNVAYTITGTGDSIRLVKEGQVSYSFDKPDYYTIERGSVDDNDWSLSNRWVHKLVLEKMCPNDIDKFEQAERPIICYQKSNELHNHGTFYRGEVDLAIDSLPTKLNGQVESQVQNVLLKSGMTVLFTEMSPLDKTQIFTINLLESGVIVLQPVYNGQDDTALSETRLNDYVRIKKGAYAGITKHFNGDKWVSSQQKKEWNQIPLYKIYDSDGIYVGSETQYPLCDYNGAVIFDYVEYDDRTIAIDKYIGKRISCDIYGNYNFINKIADLHYTYYDSLGLQQKIEGYLFAKNIATGHYSNGWMYKEATSAQQVECRIVLQKTDIIDGAFSYVIPFKSYNSVTVTVNGTRLYSAEIKWTDNGFTLPTVNLGDELIIKMYANEFDELPNGYSYELPASFTTNQFNENITEFNSSDTLEHLVSILENQDGFSGNGNGSNNCYMLSVDGSKGDKIIQNDNPILLPMTLMNNESTSVLAAIKFAMTSYSTMMKKVTNLAKKLVNTNKLNESDYDLYKSNLTELDPFIIEIFNQINLGKTSKSAFYNSGMANELGELYIPATPAYLGLQKSYKPEIISEGATSYILCHDGSRIKTTGSVADLIRLELEVCIYNSILSDFKNNDPAFDLYSIKPGFFRNSDYSFEQYNNVLSRYFINWAVENDLDYTDTRMTVSSDWRDWNWSGCQMADGTQLNGSYKSIYLYFFDTIDPSQTPWEMLGFNTIPNWWTASYGEAPYTKNNTVLWTDIENGYIRGGESVGIHENLARKGLLNYLPVDGEGNLISPYQCGIASAEPATPGRMIPWKAGDVSPVEYDYMQTPEYRFAIEAINFILRPLEWLGVNWNTQAIEIKYKGTSYQQTIDKITHSRPSLKNQVYHNTIVDGESKRVIGIQQWIVDKLSNENKSVDIYLKQRIDNLEMKLGYCAGAFIEKGSVTILDGLDEVSEDDFRLQLIQSRTGDIATYSAVKIYKVDKGFKVTGFDTIHPEFKALKPFGDKKITRELNGTRFTLYSTYNISDVATIPYGTVFNSANDVLSFLRGYQKYLTDIEGWKFNNVNGNGNLIDFELSLETFMGWATTFEEEQIENPLLIINPASLSISLIHFGSILNMNEKLSGEPNITDIRFNEIKSKNFNVSRQSFNTLFMIEDSIAGLYRAVKTEFEDIVLINCKTVFGDVLYNPVFSSMVDNLYISAIKASQWDGSLYAPGYLNLEDGLIPNLEKNAYDLNYIFDVDSEKCQTTYRNYSRTLLGYAKTKCMQDLIKNEKSMFDFYKGMIRDKGTIKPIIALNRSNLVSANTDNEELDIETLLYEYWAFKQGEYGQIKGNNSLEFKIDQLHLRNNPQNITYCLEDTIGSDDKYTIQWNDPNWLKKNKTTQGINLAKEYKDELIIPPTGHVNIADVQYTFKNYEELDEHDDEINSSDMIYIVNTGNGDWDVVKKTGISRYVSMRYETLKDAYEQKSQDLVYKVTDNYNEYYVSKTENEIQPEDELYSDINITNVVGNYRDLHRPTYNGKTFLYDARPAYKCKILDTMFYSTTLYQNLNRNSIIYCYADNTFYTYSNLLFGVGSAGTKVILNHYMFTLKIDTEVQDVALEVNGTKFDVGVKNIVIAVQDGDTITWTASAKHCKTIKATHYINGAGYTVTGHLRYKENEYLFDSIGAENTPSKFNEQQMKFACDGYYEVTLDGAGGGGAGGKQSKKKHGHLKSSTYHNHPGCGGGSGAFIKGEIALPPEAIDYATIKVGYKGAGAQSHCPGGTGGATILNIHGLCLHAGGGGGGTPFCDHYRLYTGSKDINGNNIRSGAGGIYKVYGDPLSLKMFTATTLSNGETVGLHEGAAPGNSPNPDGYISGKRTKNEVGHGGPAHYELWGEEGDNGRLRIKFLRLMYEVNPYDVVVAPEKYSLVLSSDSCEYSKVFQKFVLNTWSYNNPNPEAWTQEPFGDGTQRYYQYRDCVQHNGRLYRCIQSHKANAVQVTDTNYWYDYTNYKTDVELKEMPFYSYDVTDEDPMRPEAKIFTDQTVLYRNRSKTISGRLGTNIFLNRWDANATYFRGDIITYWNETISGGDGITYECTLDCKANQHHPTVGAKHWRQYTDLEFQFSYTDWNETTRYTRGQIVKYKEQYYICVSDNSDFQAPDLYWQLFILNGYVKLLTDERNIEDPNVMQSYFPIYWDEECTQPILDLYNTPLEYKNLTEQTVGTTYRLVDMIGTYSSLKLTYVGEPGWSSILPLGGYSVSSGSRVYYVDMDQETVEANSGTDLDIMYYTERQKPSEIAYQYNHSKLIYDLIQHVNTTEREPSYELEDGELILYTSKAPGLLELDDIMYNDSNLTEENGVYADYIPTWQKIEVTPNKYKLGVYVPNGNGIYQKIDGGFELAYDQLYILHNGMYGEYVPNMYNLTITIPFNTKFYSMYQGIYEEIKESLYMYDGVEYHEITNLRDDLTINIKSGDIKQLSLYSKVNDVYVLHNEQVYVKVGSTYDTFENVYMYDYKQGYCKLLYNDTAHTGYVDLYKKHGETYTKITNEDLYYKVQLFENHFYLDSEIEMNQVDAVVQDGEYVLVNGHSCYFNPQLKGHFVALNNILSTKDEITTIQMYRNLETDFVYKKAYEIRSDLVGQGLEPGSPEFIAEATRRANIYAKEINEEGFIDVQDIVECACDLKFNDALVSRHVKIYHYVYNVNGERNYIMLYMYGTHLYKGSETNGDMITKYGVFFALKEDLLTFLSDKQLPEVQEEILNVISYKEQGNVLYINNDSFHLANRGEYKDVIKDLYSLARKSNSKGKYGDKGWIKAEVIWLDYHFNLAAIEEKQADNTCIDSAYLVNDKTDETINSLYPFDPMQNVFPKGINTNITYISKTDPILNYNDPFNINRCKIGDLWWDISKVKYVDYKQMHTYTYWIPVKYDLTDNEFKAEQWGSQLPGSEIVINEWTESKEAPTDGTPYIEKMSYNEDTELMDTTYLWWNKNPTLIPNGSLRNYSAAYLAKALNITIASGISTFAFTETNAYAGTSSFLVGNYASLVAGTNAVIQINVDANIYSDSHSDWALIKENTDDMVPDNLWKHMIESLNGQRVTTDGKVYPLPDPELVDSLKYGINIRPRQSMIKDTYEAKRNLVQILNGITLNRTLANATDVDSTLFYYIDEETGEKVYNHTHEPTDYASEVLQAANLTTITDEDLIGSRILVKYDENYDNIWTIYRMQDLGKFTLEDWKQYDIMNFVEYADLYANETLQKMGVLATVATVQELMNLPANEGDLAKVIDNDLWLLYQLKNGSWEMVGKQNALIKFNENLYNYVSYENEKGLFIDLSDSPYWIPQRACIAQEIVKLLQDDGSVKFYRCLESHIAEDEWNTKEQRAWVEIHNETLYDYKKNEADKCMAFILEYFGK